jgi:TusA-related sulfurtransferase
MKEIKVIKIDESHYQVDMRGWMCPYPKYAVEKLIEKLPSESCMDLLVDCPSATNDVPELVKSKGLKVKKIILIADGEWCITICNY